MVLETEVQVTTGFFPGKECINENFNSWFFSGIWAENCSDIGEFFLAICQKAIYDCRGAFIGKRKNWDKFWQPLP